MDEEEEEEEDGTETEMEEEGVGGTGGRTGIMMGTEGRGRDTEIGATGTGVQETDGGFLEI